MVNYYGPRGCYAGVSIHQSSFLPVQLLSWYSKQGHFVSSVSDHHCFEMRSYGVATHPTSRKILNHLAELSPHGTQIEVILTPSPSTVFSVLPAYIVISRQFACAVFFFRLPPLGLCRIPRHKGLRPKATEAKVMMRSVCLKTNCYTMPL